MKSEAQITQERKAWAGGLLVRAWRRVEILGAGPSISDRALDRNTAALLEAVAIAEEWGLDPQAMLEESHPVELRSRE